MKWLIASDIHGSAYWCERMLELFKREKADVLVLLGDILYHGPRNELPRDYNPKKVIALLNDFANGINDTSCTNDANGTNATATTNGTPCEEPHRILCVRGNCDAEVDQMVLGFPIMADYGVIELGGRFAYLTHGHVYGEDNPPKLKRGDILIQGHTHMQRCVEKDGVLYLNPGSVSIPKGDGYNGCIVFDDAPQGDAQNPKHNAKQDAVQNAALYAEMPKAGELRGIGLEKGAFRFVGLDGVL